MNLEDGLAAYIAEVRGRLLPLVESLAAAHELAAIASAYAEKHGREAEVLDSLLADAAGEVERAHVQNLLNHLENGVTK